MSKAVETGRGGSTSGATGTGPSEKAKSKKPKAEREVEPTQETGPASETEPAPNAESASETEPVAEAVPASKAEPVADAGPASEAERASNAEPVSATGRQPGERVPNAEPTSDTEAAPSARTGGVRLSRPVLILAGVVLVLALAASVGFAVLLGLRAATDRAGEQALATARAYAVTVTSYDYQHLDQNFNDVLDGATGEFKDQYSGASSTLKQLIVSARATAKGTVLGAGVASATRDQVQVVAFVDQAITNAANPAPRQDRNRVAMTLVKIDSRWLVSKLELM